jgi:protein-S-isoprenylcysteine O-methyltransferase Ste14
MRESRRRWIRPSTTRSASALWAKSLLNAGLFFTIFMVLLPWVACRLVPVSLPLPRPLGLGAGGVLFVAGVALWLHCLAVFSRSAEGTPFPMDAPRRLATSGPFAVVRNPIMLAELATIWAEALWFANLGIVGYAVLMALLAHLGVVFVEEPELRERFGEEYDAYVRRVPRWAPRVARRAGAER